MSEKVFFTARDLVIMCSAVSIMGAVQVLQEVFGLLSSTLTEAKDFIAKCHFGISLAITMTVMFVRVVKFSRKGYKIRYCTGTIINCS